MIKKIIISALSFLLIFSLGLNLVYADSSSGDLHWYIKRNKDGIPSFPDEAEKIRGYNAYYIDSSVTDNERVIYLTFDAGYANENVEKIMDVLREENVSAAFFLLDNIILKNTDLVLRMADEGHLVCNHTKNHKNLSRSSAEDIERNLTALEKIYEEKTGREMARYFRFPCGVYSIDSLKAVNDLGYKTVFWSFAYDDWDEGRQTSPDKAYKKVIENTHNGAVMLFHPTSSTNAKIFSDLIKEWKSMGYRFGTLDELTTKK